MEREMHLVKASPGKGTDRWLNLLSAPLLQREKTEHLIRREETVPARSWVGKEEGRRMQVQLLQ